MKNLARFTLFVLIFSFLLSLASCAAKGGAMDDGGGYFGGYGSALGDSMAPGESLDASTSTEGEKSEADGEGESESNGEEIRLPSGMITAAAWNDNDNYTAWLELFKQGQGDGKNDGKFYEYTNPNRSWGYNSLNRIKVSVSSGDKIVAGAKVVAKDANGEPLFSAVTDAKGNAYLFTGADEGTVTVTSGEGSAAASFTREERELSVDLSVSAEKLNVIELMLVVDVTGSMGDEISFLKAELADVIGRIAANDSNTVIKLAMLFYRDTDDDVPFDYYDFVEVTESNGFDARQAALERQKATGGGDYPEAVDEALDIAVNKQWSTGATTKIIFHVLDAPAHDGDEYAQKLVSATKTAAEKGIRICTFICSGAAVETEYTMREAAIYTGGTFIFVTDDSGIGGSHHDPDLPNATVELLNSLMVRLVNGYHTGNFDAPVYWKEDPSLANK